MSWVASNPPKAPDPPKAEGDSFCEKAENVALLAGDDPNDWFLTEANGDVEPANAAKALEELELAKGCMFNVKSWSEVPRKVLEHGEDTCIEHNEGDKK